MTSIPPRENRSNPPWEDSKDVRRMVKSSTRNLQKIRVELFLLGGATIIWLLAVLTLFGFLPLAGLFALDLYRLYSVAGILGWVSGNVYLVRRRQLPGERWKTRLLLAYLIGPAGFVYLLRALAPMSEQAAAPFVPLYGFVVYGIFFLVPVSLRPPERRRLDT